MMPFAFIDQGFTTGSSNDYSPGDFPSMAIVCHYDADRFSAASDFAAPIPHQELVEKFSNATTNQNQPQISEITEWTPKLESKFRRLAEAKALNTLSLKGKVEFEKLMVLRRQLKNPRRGEEVLIEYRQRMLTRNLVNALSQYVSFHKMSHRPR